MTARVSLFLCGDVMTGRGIDQILSHPGDPRLYESYVSSALTYVSLAEDVNGPIPRPVDDAYIWGAALEELERLQPAARIVNLETAVTEVGQPAPKGINYRMHPKNVGCLAAARIDCCTLANNHVLDWGREGLVETIHTLNSAGIRTAGAGIDRKMAEAPAVLPLPGDGRVLVFSFGETGSGIPRDWAATPGRPGLNLLPDLTTGTANRLAATIRRFRRPNDIIVASIHWGGNWGYEVPEEHQAFARRLVELGGADIIHGHSSHHPKPFEIHRRKLILYGCGDFLNDYEGIGGYEYFRGDLVLMYIPRLNRETADLVRLDMIPLQIRKFRLNRASRSDAEWLRETLNREGRPFGTSIDISADGALTLTHKVQP